MSLVWIALTLILVATALSDYAGDGSGPGPATRPRNTDSPPAGT